MPAVQDREFMSRALMLATKGQFTTTPNPSVGCVLVKDGVIVGEGFTQPAGGMHAEKEALQVAGDNAQGATAYVTLEPCSHFGRTPPCSNALIEAGIVRVVAAMEDPNPVVSNTGLEKLKAAGIAVESGLLEDQAKAFLAGFYKRMTQGIPKIVVKTAASLDGRTAMASGESQWITGPEARYQGQRLRAASCAIITGVDSILQDDSQLTVRVDDWLQPYDGQLIDGKLRQPLRVVVDSSLRASPTAKVFADASTALVAYAKASKQALEPFAAAGIKTLQCTGDDGRVDLLALLKWLAKEKGCNQVLVEAGGTLTGSFISQQLVDELHLFQAPILLGASGKPMAGLNIDVMADKVQWQLIDSRKVGQDQWLRFRPKSE